MTARTKAAPASATKAGVARGTEQSPPTAQVAGSSPAPGSIPGIAALRPTPWRWVRTPKRQVLVDANGHLLIGANEVFAAREFLSLVETSAELLGVVDELMTSVRVLSCRLPQAELDAVNDRLFEISQVRDRARGEVEAPSVPAPSGPKQAPIRKPVDAMTSFWVRAKAAGWERDAAFSALGVASLEGVTADELGEYATRLEDIALERRGGQS